MNEKIYLSFNPTMKCTLNCKYCLGSIYIPPTNGTRRYIDLNMQQIQQSINTILNKVKEPSKIYGRFNSSDVFLCYENVVKPTIE